MSLLITILCLLLAIACVVLGYHVVLWILGVLGVSVPAQILKIIFVIIALIAIIGVLSGRFTFGLAHGLSMSEPPAISQVFV